ncbi:MAG TPA: hypothetical protein DDY81_02125 [Clostridiales bacterium]|nr:hypothetical protein [Clostridiales bacterium]
MLVQNQKRLKIAQPQTDSLRLLGIGAKPQQAEIHSCREKGAGVILSICITDALLAILVPNLVQTWQAMPSYIQRHKTRHFHSIGNARFPLVEAPPQAPVNIMF